mmetsp:Transcript_11204/g.38902  ORF Transcript_11204/g.38902 Transcript_11204/m.38902 type:complete len:650 (+) Transcript_11204:529-2478(+)
MDTDTLIAGLLHDTVEDTLLQFEDVERAFGQVVRKIVEGETKVSKLPKFARDERLEWIKAQNVEGADYAAALREDEQLENMRSMFIAMAEDWRIVVVKLADRLHNMRTLSHMPPAKRASVSRETLEIFAPLAHRLGMWQYKTELEETAFMNLFPAEYDALYSSIRQKRQTYDDTLTVAKKRLENLLSADEWLRGRIRTIAIEGRTKSTFSTWKKMRRHGVESVERIDDLIALRVVLRAEDDLSETAPIDDIALCYHVLGKVHGCWTPLPRTLKDYISSPKPNGYRSLHTTVLVGSQPLEIQIRTDSMHRVAELGAAAHWAYKDKSASLPWLQIIREWHAQVDSSSAFMQLVRNELLGTRVFCFAPHGRILNLAKGAVLADAITQIDEAETGGRVAVVNGVAADGEHELRNGDIVSFQETAPAPVALDGAAAAWVSTAAWVRCEACLPLPGDRLVGCEARGRTAPHSSVHRKCAECATLKRHAAQPGARVIDAETCEDYDAVQQLRAALAPDRGIRSMDGLTLYGFQTTFVAFCQDRTKMLLDISSAVSEVNIVNVMSETLEPRGQAAFQYTVHVKDMEQLTDLTSSVLAVPGVHVVLRSTMRILKQKGPDAFWRVGRDAAAERAERLQAAEDGADGSAAQPPPGTSTWR